MKTIERQVEQRPRPEIIPGYWDQVMDVAAWSLLIMLIGFFVYLHMTLSTISEVRSSGLLLSILASITCIGFHFLKRYPHRFNYLVRITPENAVRQYTLALRMMRMYNLIILLEFISILSVMYIEETQSIRVDEGLIVIAVMVGGFLPVGYYLWKSSGKR